LPLRGRERKESASAQSSDSGLEQLSSDANDDDYGDGY
jgi:hypothetical protein